MNVTAVGGTQTGYLTVYASGQSVPPASNLNYNKGETRAIRVTSSIGSNGQVVISNGGPGWVDVVVDLNGWFSDASVTGGSLFTGIPPSRICDTRAGSGRPCAGHTLAPNGTLTVQVADVAGMPTSGLVGVVANVTVADTTNVGFLTVYPAGAPLPTASDLNWLPGQVIPNLVVAKLSATGSLAIHNGSSGTVDVVIDASGYYS